MSKSNLILCAGKPPRLARNQIRKALRDNKPLPVVPVVSNLLPSLVAEQSTPPRAHPDQYNSTASPFPNEPIPQQIEKLSKNKRKKILRKSLSATAPISHPISVGPVIVQPQPQLQPQPPHQVQPQPQADHPQPLKLSKNKRKKVLRKFFSDNSDALNLCPLESKTIHVSHPTMNININLTSKVGATAALPLRQVPDSELGARHTDKIRFNTGASDLDILISNPAPRTYTNAGRENVNLNADTGDFWHMIIVNHGQKYTKSEILREIFSIVAPMDFYPVGYTQSRVEDYFLVRQARSAILKLLERKLRIKIRNETVHLTLKLDIAQFKLGHIYPAKVFQKAINSRYNSLITLEGISNVLDLDALTECPDFSHIEADLNNGAAFNLLCTTLDKKLAGGDVNVTAINGVRLSNNKLHHIPMFDVENLQKIRMQMFDFRNNNIQTPESFRALKKYTFTDLYINGNPVTRLVNYVSEIRQTLPFIQKIDDIFSKTQLNPRITAGTKTIPIQYPGEIYDYTDHEFNERIFRKYKTSTRWHQVMIHHEGKFNQTEILDAIFDIVAMNDFYPCYYQSDSTCDMFFIRECYEPLELLYVKRLQLRFPTRHDVVNLTLKMNVADYKPNQVLPSAAIQEQIGKRYNAMNKIMDLSNLGFSPGFEDFICRLSNPRTFSIVISQASRKYLSNIEVLKLNDNGIRSARGTHSLVWMKALKEIDLSNNNIADISLLESIPKGNFTDIWLKGNPLCLKYDKARDYFDAVKSIIPSMEVLDGKEAGQFDSVNGKQNFVCKLEGYEFVEQFVEHYFNSFDSFNRYSFIKGLYHPMAVTTISCNFMGMGEHQLQHLNRYLDNCRNLIRSISADPLINLLYGQENVSNFWSAFRQTKHDFKSFTIDLTSFTSTLVVITVNGIFKEICDTGEIEDNILAFSRTFVIKKFADGLGLFKNSAEYRIINEIVLFYRPSNKQINSYNVPMGVQKGNAQTELVTEDDEKCLMIIFNDLTGLVPGWCKKLLEKSAWNMKEALESFVEMATNYQIPDHAYAYNKTTKHELSTK